MDEKEYWEKSFLLSEAGLYASAAFGLLALGYVTNYTFQQFQVALALFGLGIIAIAGAIIQYWRRLWKKIESQQIYFH